jgi:hypothetical protein
MIDDRRYSQVRVRAIGYYMQHLRDSSKTASVSYVPLTVKEKTSLELTS